jgi:uncharacterized protein
MFVLYNRMEKDILKLFPIGGDMKTKVLLVITGILLLGILGLGLSACSTTDSPLDSSPVNVNLNSQQGIWVSGVGTVTTTPDIANVSLGVTAESPKVADALSQASTAMDSVIAALKSAGVDQKDIRTQNFSIQQTTRYDNTTQQTVVTGYQVSNFVVAKIRAIDKTGTIIDSVAAAGGDLTRINSVSFTVDKPEQYYSQARGLAMADAKDKATQLAQLGGVSLGKMTYVTENASSPGPTPIYASAGMDSVKTPTTSINPGTTDIVINVQVAYTIQ